MTLTEILWNDSSLVGCVSADLGSENKIVKRRMGRWHVDVPCPRMMFVRGENFRAVDQNDQIRLCKWAFKFICRKKGWLKLFFALIELLIVNIFIVARQSNRDLEQDDFRWDLLTQLVKKADELDEETDMAERLRSAASRDAPTPNRGSRSGRFSGDHHHDCVNEYVTIEKARANQRIVDQYPSYRTSNKCEWRKRDSNRKNDKVRNPMYTSPSNCLVCKYVHDVSKKTTKYCRECMWQPNWPKIIRAKGYQLTLHPRLCSKSCFDYFHTHRIPALDNPSSTVRSRSKRRRRSGSRTTTNTRHARRRIVSSEAYITRPTTPEV